MHSVPMLSFDQLLRSFEILQYALILRFSRFLVKDKITLKRYFIPTKQHAQRGAQ